MSDHPETSKISCSECDYDIVPGDARTPSSDGVVHTVCAQRRDARSRYRFFLYNPASQPAYSMSLFYDTGDREYPVLQNTGGLNSMMSAAKTIGDDRGVEPSPYFMPAIAYTYHWLQSYRPLPGDQERIRSEIDSEIRKHYPNEKIPSHEEWALHVIINTLYTQRRVQPELEPIVACCDDITQFSVPAVDSYS